MSKGEALSTWKLYINDEEIKFDMLSLVKYDGINGIFN